jgi:hypothetical protein
MDDDEYDFYELKDLLLEIKENGTGNINFCKAILTLVNHIEELINFNDYLMELIPLKYKKFHVKPGENPFFSKEDIHPSQEDIQLAKERMRSLLHKAKPKS